MRRPSKEGEILPLHDRPGTPSTLRSTMSEKDFKDHQKRHSAVPVYKPPNPNIFLLYSLLTRRDVCVLLIPAVLASFAAAAIPPFLTIVIGDAFDVFAGYQSNPQPTKQDRDALVRGVGLACIELAAMSGGVLLLSGVMSALWIWVGEKNAMYLRRLVYAAVTSRDMEWFDSRSEEFSDSADAAGAGGLMTQFATCNDDVRLASSLNMGMIVQNVLIVVATLTMAFVRSALLTVVIISTIPLLFGTLTVMQIFASKYLSIRSKRESSLSSHVDRALNAIATVKAFNAQPLEQKRADKGSDRVREVTQRVVLTWGVSVGFSQFILFSMFVQGFWFGSKLVMDGKISAGTVLTVFWSCLIAASNLQAVAFQLVTYAKGKSAMVTLLTLARPTPSTPKGSNYQPIVRTPKSPFFGGAEIVKSVRLQKIRPTICKGEFTLSNVTFAYPARPSVPVLSDISLYLPAQDTTFIVGGSGSGKSTLAQLFLRLYEPQSGTIHFDDQDLYLLDEQWTRGHVAAVSQSCILFDGTVHENVALGLAGSLSGRHPRDATREEVMDACRVALMHDFVRDLPDGYDTKLGNGGASLSGGQKQRLAIARAYLRDPTVLILDEATSALDGTSRLLVFEAIKQWRRNKTTIVITHDLSQIERDDFVFVLADGRLEEQGYRHDLEVMEDGHFRRMMISQGMTGGFLPAKDTDSEEEMAVERELLLEFTEEEHAQKRMFGNTHHNALSGVITPVQPWMLDGSGKLQTDGRPYSTYSRYSRFLTPQPEPPVSRQLRPRRSSLTIEIPRDPDHDHAWRRSSLQFTPTSSHRSSGGNDYPMESMMPAVDDEVAIEDDDDFETDKHAMQMTAAEASKRRLKSTRKQWAHSNALEAVPEHRKPRKLHSHRSPRSSAVKPSKRKAPTPPPEEPIVPALQIFRAYWAVIPRRGILFIGIIFAMITGAIAPVFGFVLSRLVDSVTTGTHQNMETVMKFGGIVFALAAANGLATFIKYYMVEICAMDWLRSLRSKAYAGILKQDKTWFDLPSNAPSLVMQRFISDSEETTKFVSLLIPQALVVTTMIGTGIIWALTRGWQLTLIGLALGPVFYIASVLQSHFLNKFEKRNKRTREDVNKQYYDAVANVRAIRSMALDGVFREKFEKGLESALKNGIDGCYVEGLSYGITNSLIYMAQAIIFYAGAWFMASGQYTFLQMIEVLNLVAFSVTIAAQMLTFISRWAKTKQAARDFYNLLELSNNQGLEAHGQSRFPIQGSIRFNDVSFSYPTRPDAPILQHVSLRIRQNECVAIVGASGSGKSTIAALIQRLYEPTDGSITIGGRRLADADVAWLRHHIAVVSQQPQLFDFTIEENIAYGANRVVPHAEVEHAAREANVHDFIMSLPNGYQTRVGENASLISGGQQQRIQIARALLKMSNILILDECTSSLDSENQQAIMNTITRVTNGRTTIIVTHKLDLMLLADRILVVDGGVISEEGSYDELMQRKGTFWQLASAGEWEGS